MAAIDCWSLDAFARAHSSLSARTLAAYESDLRLFAEWVARSGVDSPAGVTRMLVRRYVAALSTRQFARRTIARKAAAMMNEGGSLLTMTYAGSTRVMPNYNVMGVAKAALEASVRYLANDFGPRGIRVNAISAGPVRTLAGAGISDARHMFSYQQRNSPLRRTVTNDEVGGSAVYLLSDLSSGVTGEIHYVDSGYHVVSMPTLDELKRTDEG